jgi:hypothetical protein
MTDERTLERLMGQIRGEVAELRRLERNGAPPEEVAERRRLFLSLQERFAYAVRDVLSGTRTSPTRRVAHAGTRRPYAGDERGQPAKQSVARW